MKITLSAGHFCGTEIEHEPVNGDVIEMPGPDEYGNDVVHLYRVDVHPKSKQVSAVYVGEKELPVAAVTGDAILDFGVTPNGYATVDVTGQTGITGASKVEAYLDPILAAALFGFVTNGADEHALADIKISCTDLIAGVGFTIRGFYRARPGLTGTWAVSWVYTT